MAGELSGDMSGDMSADVSADMTGDGADRSFAPISGNSDWKIVAACTSSGAFCTADAMSAGLDGSAGVGAAVELASNTAPHRGQKRACGLHSAWHWPQTFSMAAVGAGDEFCLAPQLLQNLALGVSGLLHSEQFIVCNR